MEGTFEQCLHQCVNSDLIIHPACNSVTAIKCQTKSSGH